MEIGLTGASGFLGRHIIDQAIAGGDKVVAFSRNPRRQIRGCVRTQSFGPGLHLNGLGAVVHLAGESIFGVWTNAKKEHIFRSRVEGTRWIVKAIQGAPDPPKVLVCASAIGIYGDRGEEELTERRTTGAGEFLAEVSEAWEAAAKEATAAGTRVVSVRIALVLGSKGALAAMQPIFRLGLGGRFGKGDQWMSWVHVRDIANIFLYAAKTESLSGPVNGASPNPVRNSEFTRVLGTLLNKPTFFTVPSFLVSTFLPEQSSLVLDSQKVIPEKLLTSGFQFQFPSLNEALHDLLKPKVRPEPSSAAPSET
ncbi:MAG: TIGR01777 family oxidoreductase [Verrucomicrobia bacterium]|nr:TIGR01777 family oxidoreductase [Verrucomicrobiota bacterium]MBV8483468.1 TIGR01777 family oxidoreductase [Verrucomicrobiota bacterium]